MTKEKKVNESPVKFLETIDAFGNSILIPIERIKFVHIAWMSHWVIEIVGDNDSFEEHFPNDKDDERLNKRFDKIKNIIGAK